MRPLLFRIGKLDIHSYPALQYIGLTLGVLAGNVLARVTGLDAFRVFVATILLLFPALAGARVLYLLIHWKFYRDNPRRIWNTREGGAAQYGGILVAVPLSIPLLNALSVPFGAFWDVAGVTIMIGMTFTRIGCFLNGCCAGRESRSWVSLYLPNIRGEWKRRFPAKPTKSGLMVGLGETDVEILAVMRDMRAHDIDMLTLGQYLQPTVGHLPVLRYVHPEAFANFQLEAYAMGFRHAAVGALVRSSYHADKQAEEVIAG